MMTMTYNRRQGLSILLVLSMIFSMWLTVSPMNHADAGILSAVGGIAKSLFVNVGALAAGAMTAVVGAAVGGGPLGMAIGGVAGFFIGKKVLNWTTSSVANFATVAGAIGGGLLCAGMGFPMLAIGVLGGGLVSRLLVKGVSALIKKVTGGGSIIIKKSDVDSAAAAAENAEIAAYMQKRAAEEQAKVAQPAAEAVDSQTAYNNYIAAYEKYVACTQNGDAKGAKAAYEDYSKNMSLYQSLLKAGK